MGWMLVAMLRGCVGVGVTGYGGRRRYQTGVSNGSRLDLVECLRSAQSLFLFANFEEGIAVKEEMGYHEPPRKSERLKRRYRHCRASPCVSLSQATVEHTMPKTVRQRISEAQTMDQFTHLHISEKPRLYKRKAITLETVSLLHVV